MSRLDHWLLRSDRRTLGERSARGAKPKPRWPPLDPVANPRYGTSAPLMEANLHRGESSGTPKDPTGSQHPGPDVKHVPP